MYILYIYRYIPRYIFCLKVSYKSECFSTQKKQLCGNVGVCTKEQSPNTPAEPTDCKVSTVPIEVEIWRTF